jgi:predicted phosphodiesterase
VRVLLLSDIHSNLEALEACLAVAPPHDVVINLGDVVGYGASPNQVVERVRGLGEIFVRGNHDKAASGAMELRDFNPIAGLAALWTREQLMPDNLKWLRALPQGPIQVAELAGVQFVHGSPVDEDEYVVTLRDAIEPLLVSATPVTFFGHTHLQGCFSANRVSNDYFRPQYNTVGQHETLEFGLKEGVRYMVNPGSVGQPRDGDWRAAFAMFDSEARVITFCRVPYNLKQAQDRILTANLPQRLATRLAAGR